MRISFLTAAIAVLALAACPSPQAKAPDSPAVDSVTVESLSTIPMLVDSNTTLDIYWRPNNDGKGPLSGFVVYAYDDQGVHRDTLPVLPNSARSARIVLGPYSAGTFSGQVCVVALRRQLNSAPACEPWTKTFVPPVIPAPPTPIVSALVPSAVEDTVSLRFTVDDVADANGVSTALIIRAGDNAGIDSDSIQIPITSTSATIKLAKYAYGSTPTGFGCVYQIRNGVVSEGRCLSWSILIPDVPPPPVVIDSLILRLEEVTYMRGSTTGKLYTDEAIPLGFATITSTGAPNHGVCVFAVLKNGKVGWRIPYHEYVGLGPHLITDIPQVSGCAKAYTTKYTSTQRALSVSEQNYLRMRLRCLRFTVGPPVTNYYAGPCDRIVVNTAWPTGKIATDLISPAEMSLLSSRLEYALN